MSRIYDDMQEALNTLTSQQRSSDEALRKAMASLRLVVSNAYDRWEATGHLDEDVRARLDANVRFRVSNPSSRTFGEALEHQRDRSAVMRAICLTFMGEVGSPWNYECVVPMGAKPYITVYGYKGLTGKNVRDMRDVLQRHKVKEELPDSGFGF